MKRFIILIGLHLIINNIFSQNIEGINFALASHPMKVKRIEYTENQTKIELIIENQIEKGNFCADKNIDIVDVLTKKSLQLIKSEGIPICPNSYQFKYVGEVLTFQLYFPKLNNGTKYINIIENCDQYCFSIKGIILDDNMNKEVNLGYEYYNKGKLDFALQAFKMAVDNNPDYPFGFVYFNIIQILVEKKDYQSAKYWYTKLKNSNLMDKNEVISRLKSQSYYLNII